MSNFDTFVHFANSNKVSGKTFFKTCQNLPSMSKSLLITSAPRGSSRACRRTTASARSCSPCSAAPSRRRCRRRRRTCRACRSPSKDANESYWIIMNNFYRFQNFRQFSNLFSKNWLKSDRRHSFLEFGAKSGKNSSKFAEKMQNSILLRLN